MYLSIQIHLSKILCSNCKWNWQRQYICFNNNCIYRAWLQKWVFVPYVLRRYQSGDVTWISFRFVLLCCAVPSQLRNSSVFPHFHSDSNGATSGDTREYETVPERPSRNEEQNRINVSKRCPVGPDVHFSMKPWIPCNIFLNLNVILLLSYYRKTFDLLFAFIPFVSAREKALWCPFLAD